jgi:hypothetical protein
MKAGVESGIIMVLQITIVHIYLAMKLTVLLETENKYLILQNETKLK